MEESPAAERAGKDRDQDRLSSAERLTGRNNYTKWAKAFKNLALRQNVWKYINGEQLVVEEPAINDYTPEDTTGITQVSLHLRLKKYDIAVEKFRDYEKKSRLAQSLILQNVDDIIGSELEERDYTPATAWIWLKERFFTDERETAHILIKKWDDIRFENNTSMQTYINNHKYYYQRLKDMKVVYPEVVVMAKIINYLPKRFINWTDRYFELRKGSGFKDTLDNLENMLIIEDEKLNMRYDEDKDRNKRDKEKKSKEKEKDKATNTSNKKDDKKDTKSCSVCKKTGHESDTCWFNPDNPKNKLADSNNKKIVTVKKDIAAFAIFDDDIDDIDDKGTSATQHDICMFPLSKHSPTQADLSRSEYIREKGDRSQGGSEHQKKLSGSSCSPSIVNTETEESTNILYTLVTPNGPLERNAWILDSGATKHICQDLGLFRTFTYAEQSMGTADQSKEMRITGTGTVVLPLSGMNAEGGNLTLSDVAYIPSARCNLLSISTLETKAKVGVHFGNGQALISDSDDNPVAYGTRVGKLYQLAIDINRIERFEHYQDMVATLVDLDDLVWKWHFRLGHLSFENMRKLNKASDGMNLTDRQIKAKVKTICPIYATSRALNVTPRDPAKRTFKNVGELLHIDN